MRQRSDEAVEISGLGGGAIKPGVQPEAFYSFYYSYNNSNLTKQRCFQTSGSFQWVEGRLPSMAAAFSRIPLSSEYGTYKTVTAILWPWLSGKGPYNLSRCSLFAWKWARVSTDRIRRTPFGKVKSRRENRYLCYVFGLRVILL